jgi:hypothetical protein
MSQSPNTGFKNKDVDAGLRRHDDDGTVGHRETIEIALAQILKSNYVCIKTIRFMIGESSRTCLLI